MKTITGIIYVVGGLILSRHGAIYSFLHRRTVSKTAARASNVPSNQVPTTERFLNAA